MIASHNTMTYLKPKKWYLYPFTFITRCQSKNIQKQYKSGVRYFDLRISYNRNKAIEFKHGLMSYKGNVIKTLEYLNSLDNPVFVRLVLEATTEKELNKCAKMFKEDCYQFEKDYKNIHFTSGQCKYDWRTLYKFNHPIHSIDEDYASAPGNPKILGLFPFLYKRKIKNSTADFIMIDFV